MTRAAQKEFEQFKKTVWDFYKKNRRDLPWRRTTNPYKILVSEIMLQQTQVSRVLLKYQEFIEKFPDFEVLAKAPLTDILKVWSGLGYNRRALYLQKIAHGITAQHVNKFPRDPKVLETFPGIGRDTARSIVTLSFNKPLVFIETNIRRVFIHHFFKDKENIDDKQILPFIEQTLDRKSPREWYYALMDYGAHLGKTVENPNKKSKHYTVQSSLKGSIREARGKILKVIIANPKLKVSELEEKVGVERERFEKALSQLLQEQFVSKHDIYIVLK